MEAVYVDLPIGDAGAASVAEGLESAGFGFLGIAPLFSSNSDVLRLAYLVDPLAREAIHTAEPFADRLVDYVLDEQQRVQKAL